MELSIKIILLAGLKPIASAFEQGSPKLPLSIKIILLAGLKLSFLAFRVMLSMLLSIKIILLAGLKHVSVCCFYQCNTESFQLK